MDEDTLLLVRRIAAVLNGGFAALQLATAAMLGLGFGGMGTLFVIIGIAEKDLVPGLFGGAFGGFGVVLALLIAVSFLPNLVAVVALWQRGRIWREVVALVAAGMAFTQFPHGTIVALTTGTAVILELVARVREKPAVS